MSQTSDVKTQEEELLKAQREDLPAIPKVSPERLSPSKNSPLRHIISSDSDSGSDSGDESEEIDWRPASSSHMADFRDHLPSSPSLSPSLKETFDDTKDSSFIGLNIPKHGFGDDLDDDDVEEGDDEDEESIFLNPEMTPLEIKAMRLKKFGLNYQRSLSSSSPEKGKETAFSAKNTTSLGNSKGTLHRVDVHVGVSLLDDDDDDGVESDDEQISKSLPASRSTPQKGRNGPLASPQYTNSPSATAWMHS